MNSQAEGHRVRSGRVPSTELENITPTPPDTWMCLPLCELSKPHDLQIVMEASSLGPDPLLTQFPVLLPSF